MNEIYSKNFVVDDSNYETKLTKKFLARKSYIPKDPSKILAFIPGIVREIYVKPGNLINKGDTILILEAMKMMNELKAERKARVKSIYVKSNQLVSKGELMIELELSESGI